MAMTIANTGIEAYDNGVQQSEVLRQQDICHADPTRWTTGYESPLPASAAIPARLAEIAHLKAVRRTGEKSRHARALVGMPASYGRNGMRVSRLKATAFTLGAVP